MVLYITYKCITAKKQTAQDAWSIQMWHLIVIQIATDGLLKNKRAQIS